jgi:membrane protein implicated in regulation of membrane protease activity
MNKLKIATGNIVLGSPIALVLLSILIFWSKYAYANNELWKALILAVTTNVVMFVYLLILAIFWRAVRQDERQSKKEKQVS